MKKYIIPGIGAALVIALIVVIYSLQKENANLRFENGNKDYFYAHTIDSIATERKRLEKDNDSLLRMGLIKEVSIVLLESKLNAKDQKLKYEQSKVDHFTPATRNLYLDSILRSAGMR